MSRFQFSRRRVVNILRLLWILVIIYFESWIFHYAACQWPTMESEIAPTHVLLVADPQILDHESYPGRPALLTYISQVLVDLNLRKSWRAALRTKPDAIFILGDLMDNGRLDMSDSEYDRYAQRFKSIFSQNGEIPLYYIPGNHDVGLGQRPNFSPQARKRFESHFGPLNSHVSIANYTFVMIDAPGLVDEDYLRHGKGRSYADWTPLQGGSIDFVQKFAEGGITESTILLCHIPLSRPEGSNCGPYREKGTISRGVGWGYQNTLGKDSSVFLLEHLRPTLIFSGDDHDYCEYTHTLQERGSYTRVREVTVKSLSIAMGIREPGYHMLSLIPPGGPTFTHSDALCLMPDQLSIYLSTYIPLALISILILFVSGIFHGQHYRSWSLLGFRPLTSGHSKRQSRDIGGNKGSRTRIHMKRPTRTRIPPFDDYGFVLEDDSDMESINSYLPPPVSSSPALRPANRNLWKKLSLCVRGRSISIPVGISKILGGKRGGFFSEFLCDVRDVAVFPLGLFFIISFWTMNL